MNSCHRIALWLIAAATCGLTGCSGLNLFAPGAGQPPSNYAQSGPTLRPTGTREWQIQMLKELTEIRGRYDEEKAKRVKAEKEIERFEAEASRANAARDQAGQALGASEKRIAELETQIAGSQSECQRLQRELQLLDKKFVEARTRMEKEAQRADQLESKLLTEQADHVKTQTELVRLQIEKAKRELAAGKTPGANND